MNTCINVEGFFYFVTIQSVRSGQILLLFYIESLVWRLANWSVAMLHFWKLLRKCLMTQLGDVASCWSPLAVIFGIDRRRQYLAYKVKALVILPTFIWRSRGWDCRSPSIILSTAERWVVCFTLRRSLCLFRAIISCCTSNSELYRSGGSKFILRFELLTSELFEDFHLLGWFCLADWYTSIWENISVSVLEHWWNYTGRRKPNWRLKLTQIVFKYSERTAL